MTGHKLNNSEALKFIFAGKSIVTLLNSKTENRFTFKVKSVKNSNLYFVSVLTGSETYSYIGTCTEGVFRHGKKSTISKEAQSVKTLRQVIIYKKRIKVKRISHQNIIFIHTNLFKLSILNIKHQEN